MDTSTTISLIAFVCFFGAGLLGMRLRTLIPEHHLADDSRHLLETALGIIGTVGGLVLGLLVGQAFGSFNVERNALVQLSANLVVVDRVLAHYGPEAAPARVALRGTVVQMIDDLWPPPGRPIRVVASAGANDDFADRLEALKPKNDVQASLKGTAMGLVVGIAQTRWQMYEQLEAGISPVILGLLIFWFSITFAGLGVFAKANPTVVTMLFLAAVALSGALLLLQEMSMPLQGLVTLPDAPLRAALTHLGG
jgi:hypothetical protein